MNVKTKRMAGTGIGLLLAGLAATAFPTIGGTSEISANYESSPPVTHSSPIEVYEIEITNRGGELWDPNGVVLDSMRRCPLPRVVEARSPVIDADSLAEDVVKAARLAAELECVAPVFAIIKELGQPLDIFVSVQGPDQQAEIAQLVGREHPDAQTLIEIEITPGDQTKEGTDG